MPRLILDASTLVRWSGPPVGILRVEAELVRAALERWPATIIALYDTRTELYRTLDRNVLHGLLAQEVVIDCSALPDPNEPRPRLGKRLERAVRPRRLAITGLHALGRLPLSRRWQEAIERLTLGWFEKGRVVEGTDNKRRRLVRLDAAAGSTLSLSREDVVLSAGADWNTRDAKVFEALQKRSGFRSVLYCHDLMPILFPQWFTARDAAVFRQYYEKALRFCGLFVCNSQRTADDLTAFARGQSVPAISVRVRPLGADPGSVGGEAHSTLPEGIEEGRFILYVSTIEPRKNHDALLAVWRRLAGITTQHRFKLVLVGREGWTGHEVSPVLTPAELLSKNVVLLNHASDALLDRLYRSAAFSVYPSLYEGFGLPVIESLRRGLPVIASSVGALPEVTQGLAPLLDPRDESAWENTIRHWIETPSAREAYAKRIAQEFAWPTWSEASDAILRAAVEPGP